MKMTMSLDEGDLKSILVDHFENVTGKKVGEVRFRAEEDYDQFGRTSGSHRVTCEVEMKEDE